MYNCTTSIFNAFIQLLRYFMTGKLNLAQVTWELFLTINCTFLNKLIGTAAGLPVGCFGSGVLLLTAYYSCICLYFVLLCFYMGDGLTYQYNTSVQIPEESWQSYN